MEKTLVDESSDDNIASSSNLKNVGDLNNESDVDQSNNFEDDDGEYNVEKERISHPEQVENEEDKHNKLSLPTDKQAIQSQQQRLQREAQFSIPYHKPKKYTLKEFLSRRTIIKPCESAKENGFSEAFGRSRNLKMSKEELEVYSKLMEDRAKEASEFFKGDSTDGSVETQSKGDEKNCNTVIVSNNQENLNEANSNLQNPQEANENKECREKNASNIVITEIVELPKLDLNDISKELNLKNIINATLLPKERTVIPLNSNSNVSHVFETSPTLKGRQDITFDLISIEKDTHKTFSRANSLLERLMKTNKCHKPKTNESIGINSPKCKTKTLIEDTEAYSNKKPGESFLKLKDNLKSIIVEKRREEMKKKQMEENSMKNSLDDGKSLEDSEEFEEKLLLDSSDNSESETDGESVNEDHFEDDNKDVSIELNETLRDDCKPSDVGRMRIELNSDDSSESQHFNPSAISQLPATQICNPDEEADQLINLCSGTFETQPTPAQNEEIIGNEIISSSEENSTRGSGKKMRTKKLTKKMKKSKIKLGFSDDEADESDTNEVTNEKSLSINDEPTTYIDYDSEENEITVELTKQDCLKQAETFFEKEAELSESEWGSADEDEKNLDQYENELGDEDVFDKEEIRDELGKIHARKMLDEDLRQVHKLQEILFEDEDEAAQRQRKFRWKNFDNSFNLEIGQNNITETKADEEGSDDENEHLWRKIRFEREQAIKNNSLNENILEASSSVVTPKINDIKNVTRVNMTKSIIDGSEEKEKSPFLISKELIKSESAKARSSFLLRNKKVLTKTICSVKSSNNDVNTSPDKIGVKTTNSNKFVFTTLTYEEHETLKRKADDTTAGIDTKIVKRAKKETKKAEYLIDKLL